MGTTIVATDAPDYWDPPPCYLNPSNMSWFPKFSPPWSEIIASFPHAATCTSCKRVYVLVLSFLCQGPDNLAQFHAQSLNVYLKPIPALRALQVICLLVSTPIIEIYLNDFALSVKQAQGALESRNREEFREAINAAGQYTMALLNNLFIVKPVVLEKVLGRHKAYWNALLELYRLGDDSGKSKRFGAPWPNLMYDIVEILPPCILSWVTRIAVKQLGRLSNPTNASSKPSTTVFAESVPGWNRVTHGGLDSVKLGIELQ